jgi:predicted ribosomally synthesized peptide with nif11-like leader
MSSESAKAFVEKMKTDADFAKKVMECKGKEAREAFVKNAGFDFSVEDLKTSKAELTDEELELVAGGSYHSYWCKNVPGQ